jgi:hypothetical protein
LRYNENVFNSKRNGLNGAMIRFPIFILLILSLVFACSTPSWFPIKKGPPHRAKIKELLDKEVILVDGHEYVKVLDPHAQGDKSQPGYLYVPVDQYLSRKESYATPTIKEEAKRESPVTSIKPAPPVLEREVKSPPSPLVATRPDLKKKVMITHFDDRTAHADELLGDWVSEKLVKEVNRRSPRILLVDYRMVGDFLQKNGFSPADLERPKVLHLINEVFGIHAVVLGQLTGPYVFTTKTGGHQEPISSAIIKVEIKVVNASGKALHLSAQNPVVATKETGSFSDEKAKIKAIDLAVSELGRSLSREIEGLEWFCRIAKVEGNEYYINAGKLSGLKIGDVMDVSRSGDSGETTGKIRISGWFGIDASIGTLVQGNNPGVNDILKPTRGERI